MEEREAHILNSPIMQLAASVEEQISEYYGAAGSSAIIRFCLFILS